MTNSYEDKQAARRERYEELADKNRARSTQQFEASRRAVDGIPMGQPILVGHHSEGRHRAALARSDSAMRKSVEAQRTADYYARKAEGVGGGGISSDDPEAIAKLRGELKKLQDAQDVMKAANKAIRAHKTPEARIAALVKVGLTEIQAAEIIKPDFAGRVGFASYQLSNANANMRRIEQRIKVLEANQERTSTEAAGDGYTYRQDADENRVMFIFEGKPDEATRALLKANGFNWSPSRDGKPWVRQWNNAGVYHAQVVRKTLDAMHGAFLNRQDEGKATRRRLVTLFAASDADDRRINRLPNETSDARNDQDSVAASSALANSGKCLGSWYTSDGTPIDRVLDISPTNRSTFLLHLSR